MATHFPPDLLSEQIANQIKLQIRQGDLAPGAKLPSLRHYSQIKGVAKNTVVQAYELLVADGYVEPRHGSGFYVVGVPQAPVSAERWAPALDHALAGIGIDRSAFHLAGGGHSVGEGLPPSAWLENCRLDRYMHKIGRSGLGSVFRYGDPYGYLPLRQSISQKLGAYGIEARSDQIILTQGAYQAVDILIRHMVRPGDTVLVDAPGFYPTFNKLSLQGARIIGVPRTPLGPDLVFLKRALRASRAKLFFTQSVGHNPTGSDISAETARELLALAASAGLTIVDDDALADYKPGHCARLASLDQLENTIYVGSFSKSLSSVVRVGFLACAPRHVRELVSAKTVLSLNSSPFAERTVHAVITEGRFHKHVLDLQQRTRRAVKDALRQFGKHGATVFCTPEHSLFLWVKLPGVEDAAACTRALLERGFALTPGAIFLPEPGAVSPWFRFNVGFMQDAERMSALWRAIATQQRGA